MSGMRREAKGWVFEQNSQPVNLVELCQEQLHPFYLYDLDGICQRVKDFRESFTNLKNKLFIHYALKANINPYVIQAFYQHKLGLDVVSGGEIQYGLRNGFKGQDMVFSGVGKTIHEIKLALTNGIKQINVESVEELERVGKLAETLECLASVALRLNPNISSDIHPYIRTGLCENKFGIDSSFLPEVKKVLRKYTQSLDLVGLSLHIGSQIQDISPIIKAIEVTKPIYFDLCKQGYNLQTMDIGGGVGINYGDENIDSDLYRIKDYGARVSKIFSDWPCEVLCEPGRVLVGRFGFLFGEVQYVKRTSYKNFAILNTGMHHLMRPCLYQAHHRIEKLGSSDSACELYDIVGPICESSDVIGFDRYLPKLCQGDYLMICDVGAYGFVMANHYNRHDLPTEVVYSKGKKLHSLGQIWGQDQDIGVRVKNQ